MVLYVFMVAYTILVATIVVLMPVIWKVGVRTLRSFSEGIKYLLWSRSHPGEPEEEPKQVNRKKRAIKKEQKMNVKAFFKKFRMKMK